ncbi:MAG: alginate export family protein [Kiritimatiellia bacterium]
MVHFRLLSTSALATASLFASTVSFAASPTVADEPLQSVTPIAFDFGGELRLRYDGTHALPTSSHGESENSDYLRLRTRLWGQMTAGQLTGFLRLADEFRYYRSPNSEKGKQRFPDTVFIDALYLTYADAFNGLMTITVGRQEMAFGAKRIISDGTGGDGSRSAYFDGARLTLNFDRQRTLDLFGVYMARHDWLPTLGKKHDATEAHTKAYDYETSGYNQTEYGAGLYYQDRSNKAFGWDAYYVYKVEDGEHSKVINKVTKGTRTLFQTSTAGFRLLPQFTETISGEGEFALQAGTDSLLAVMAYAGVSYAPKVTMKPKLTLATQFLSGDEKGYRGDHAWHAVFNRETGIGEVPAPMYDKYAYNNLLYPHVKVELTPFANHTVVAQVGPMFAPVREERTATEDYGNFRGLYAQVKYSFAVGKCFDAALMKGFSLAFTGEYLGKGDYFKDDAGRDALFGRAELNYKF